MQFSQRFVFLPFRSEYPPQHSVLKKRVKKEEKEKENKMEEDEKETIKEIIIFLSSA
jgi:hypothetical protein